MVLAAGTTAGMAAARGCVAVVAAAEAAVGLMRMKEYIYIVTNDRKVP